jgi:hypothetical protein
MKDLVVTVSLSTAIILIVALASLAGGVLFFLLATRKLHRASGRSKTQVPPRSVDLNTISDKSAPKQSTASLPDPTEPTEAPGMAVLGEIRDEIRGISARIDRLGNLIQENEDLRKQESERILAEQARRSEEESRQAEELRQQKIARLGAAQDRLSEALKSDLVRVAGLIHKVIDELMERAETKIDLADAFGKYLELDRQARELAERTNQFETSELLSQQTDIEREIESFEANLRDLEKEHRAAWFTDLLQETARYPSLHDQANELKQLLKLEEVQVQTGAMPDDLTELDVVSSEGRGSRAVISEVVENGYRLMETGTVLKRPKVRVHFEV